MEHLTNKVKETLNLSSPQVKLSSSFEKHAVTHPATTNSSSWKAALANTATPAEGYLLTKTLVFKPKVAKSETPIMIVVVALDDTATSSSQIAKAAGEKDARFATAEAVKEALGVNVEQGIPPSSFSV
jgi:prolyl-tRNA synthetase